MYLFEPLLEIEKASEYSSMNKNQEHEPKTIKLQPTVVEKTNQTLKQII